MDGTTIPVPDSWLQRSRDARIGRLAEVGVSTSGPAPRPGLRGSTHLSSRHRRSAAGSFLAPVRKVTKKEILVRRRVQPYSRPAETPRRIVQPRTRSASSYALVATTFRAHSGCWSAHARWSESQAARSTKTGWVDHVTHPPAASASALKRAASAKLTPRAARSGPSWCSARHTRCSASGGHGCEQAARDSSTIASAISRAGAESRASSSGRTIRVVGSSLRVAMTR